MTKNRPKWTVSYYIYSVGSLWMGRVFEFFDEHGDAKACYDRHQLPKQNAIIRAYNTRSDRHHHQPNQRVEP